MFESEEMFHEKNVLRSPIQSVIETMKELKIPMGKIKRNLPKLEEKYNNIIPAMKFRLKAEKKQLKQASANEDDDEDEESKPVMKTSFTTKLFVHTLHEPGSKAGIECRDPKRSWLLTIYDEGDGTGIPMSLDRFVSLWGGTKENIAGTGLYHEIETILRYEIDVRYTKLSGCSTTFRIERFSNIPQSYGSKTVFTIDNEFLRRKQAASLQKQDAPIRKFASGDDDINPEADDADGA